MDLANRDKNVVRLKSALWDREVSLMEYFRALKGKAKSHPNPHRAAVLEEYRDYYKGLIDCSRDQESALESIITHIEEMNQVETDRPSTNKSEDQHELTRLRSELGSVRKKIKELSDLIYE
jgi:hypothetical protein